MFRFAAGGVGGAANKNDRKFLGFAPRELVERGRNVSIIRQTIFRIRILDDCCFAPPKAGRSEKLAVYKLAEGVRFELTKGLLL